jgi:hypothetical protein
VIPDDIFETAIEECHKTLKREDPRSTDEKIRDMVVAFDALGISQAELEGLLQHPLKGVTDIEIRTLGKVYRSIADGVGTKEEWFKKSSTIVDAKARIDAEKQKAADNTTTAPAPTPAEPQTTESADKSRKPRSDRGVPRKPREEAPTPLTAESKVAPEAQTASTDETATAVAPAAPGEPFDPIKELYSIADRLWGNKAGGMLMGQCKLVGVDITALTHETASTMIDILNEKIAMFNQDDIDE